MALSDAYMLRDIQVYDNETILNVYFYQDLLLSSNAENLVTFWNAQFLPAILQIQSDDITHVKVDAVNLADPGNFFEIVIDETGLNTQQSLPAHDAINFSLRLNTKLVRPGSKRYCGISEPFTTNNFITDATYLTDLEALRQMQYAIILGGVIETFQPIVVKRIKYNPDPEDLTHFAYRLPENDGEYVFGDVVNALLNTRISHQVSRNNGRG